MTALPAPVPYPPPCCTATAGTEQVSSRTWRGKVTVTHDDTGLVVRVAVCDHVHRHHDTALTCGRRLTKTIKEPPP